jgi:hypothetical protein
MTTINTSSKMSDFPDMLDDYNVYEKAIGTNFFDLDPNIKFILKRTLTSEDDLAFGITVGKLYGDVVGSKIAPNADITDKHGPVLKSYDEWGYRINEIVHNESWIQNKADLVRIGVCSLETHFKRNIPAAISSMTYYLVSQAETALLCALGMTAGAADIAERYAPVDLKDKIVSKLRSDDPEQSWEAGMFLTERQGGSDVGANTLKAVADGNEFRLYGDKHFCSNVDADLFVVLARPEGAVSGTKGLATFLVPRRLFDGTDNGFTIRRLKPKLGTVGVPTGEVHLEGSVAWLASKLPVSTDEIKSTDANLQAATDGKGLTRMMEMVNGSRFGVALMGLGIHRRCFLEAAIYAARREQFGVRIDHFPLVRQTLVDLVVELEAGSALTFDIVTNKNSKMDSDLIGRLIRIQIPLAKLRCTRYGLIGASKALEIFGGNGYMEDWPMARQFRDAQCHPIWEGTENIICRDVFRAIKSVRAHEAVFKKIELSISEAKRFQFLKTLAEVTQQGLDELKIAIDHVEHTFEDESQLHSRDVAHFMADMLCLATLIDEAVFSLENNDARKALIAIRFAKIHLPQNRLSNFLDPDRSSLDLFEPIIRYGIIPEPLAQKSLEGQRLYN